MPSRKCLALLLLTCLAAMPVCAQTPAAKTSDNGWSVQLQPEYIVNGSSMLFEVEAPGRLKSLEGTWLGHAISFTQDPKNQLWFGLAAVSLQTKPGTYPLLLTALNDAGGNLSFRKEIAVEQGQYREIAVTVAKKFTEPNPKEQKKIAADRTVKQEFLSRTSPARKWNGDFTAPVDAATSDVFGTRRTFNGKVQSVHQGLDYAVGAGTPVHAVNRGTVLLARPLYFEGGFVVLDHGQGLLTLYLHLSKIEVKEGDQVDRGQEIALSGGTGRATGPHLHIAVRWNGIYADPATLLTLKIPAIP